MTEKFYMVRHGWAGRYFWLESVEEMAGRISYSKLVKSGKLKKVKPRTGTTFGDIMGGDAVPILFSEKLVTLLRHHGIKIKIWPVEIILDEKIKKKFGLGFPEYYYIEPISYVEFLSDGSFLEVKKREMNRKKLDTWLKNKNKIYFEGNDILKAFYNLSSWDGSELFGAKDTDSIIITEDFKKIIERAKLKNILFKELKKLGGPV